MEDMALHLQPELNGVKEEIETKAGSAQVAQAIAGLKVELGKRVDSTKMRDLEDKVAELKMGQGRLAHDIATWTGQETSKSVDQGKEIRETVKNILETMISQEQSRDHNMDGWLLMQKADRSYCEALFGKVCTEVGEHLDRIEIQVIGALREELMELTNRVNLIPERGEIRNIKHAVKSLIQDAETRMEWDKPARTPMVRASDRVKGVTGGRETASSIPPIARMWLPDTPEESLGRWGSRSYDSARVMSESIKDKESRCSTRDVFRSGDSITKSMNSLQPIRPATDRPATTPWRTKR